MLRICDGDLQISRSIQSRFNGSNISEYCNHRKMLRANAFYLHYQDACVLLSDEALVSIRFLVSIRHFVPTQPKPQPKPLRSERVEAKPQFLLMTAVQ